MPTSPASRADLDGRARVVIEDVKPQVDGGRFAVKRVSGQAVAVEADVFADGHDAVRAEVLWRAPGEAAWRRMPMQALGNDRFSAAFTVDVVGCWLYTLDAWVDPLLSWRLELGNRVDADDIALALLRGAELIEQVATRAVGDDGRRLHAWAGDISVGQGIAVRHGLALDQELHAIAAAYPDRSAALRYDRELRVDVDRPLAGCSAWYEFFPRSCAPEPGRHGSLRDCEARLDYIARMGFDIVYLPPIHPIGRVKRKGPNNTLDGGPGAVGSPWAIGNADGGHMAIDPQLGTLADFRRFVQQARQRGLDLALDLAFQCAPDHPYVAEHPEWFRHRPDGSVQSAENPPKRYEDIYPFDFESPAWHALWRELERIVRFWLSEGVRIFRVDNPHTKPFVFWQWLLGEIKRDHPDVILLAEAFTRPKIMRHLAKVGFTQSYTYFAWRNTKQELTDYFTELAHGDAREYFRPNCWPNTPDILTEYLQVGGRAAFVTRVVLAATLSANYGIYGPAFELLEHEPRAPGSEEYLHSEKYDLRHWDVARADSLQPIIARLNRIRKDNIALQTDWSLQFHRVDNEHLLCYSKSSASKDNTVVTVVNLDPYHVQSGWVDLDLDAMGLDPQASYQMHDLLSDARYLWQGARNFVQLDPAGVPAHVLRVRRRVRTGRDFDYFL